MKIPYKHFLKYIDSDLDINQLSESLFQLGHEHEIHNEIFDFELTPNRGDCISLDGMLRDLNLLYDVINNKRIYQKEIKPYDFKFLNDAKESCWNISFLKIDIDAVPKKYTNSLEDYFSDLDIKKINFFTDVSNFISYESGQPTHCYDASKVADYLRLNTLNESCEFETLLDKKINIEEGDLVFTNEKNQVINLAGIVGGESTSCNIGTTSVIVECAYFDPEAIIGKAVKYDINSDAAHKFERNTDPLCHEYVIRRFLKVVEDHCNIINVELFQESYKPKDETLISFNAEKINRILGTSIKKNECLSYLKKLGFLVSNNFIHVPSYRNDIKTINDISEEIARAVGYNNINSEKFDIKVTNESKINFNENKIKKLLLNEGFYEVINSPFVSDGSSKSVQLDNPLDSNKKYLRTNLKDSLLDNLLFNERRQKDSIKLFEVSDLYSNKARIGKKVVGMIASGRINKNYLDFSKKINNKYFENILSKVKSKELKIQEIPRQSLNSKSKDPIFYSEIEIDQHFEVESSFDNLNINNISHIKYVPISEFPSSNRDLSFSIKDFSKCKQLEDLILNYRDKLLKEVFVFDYYKNEKTSEIKIGFRFIFQSKESTITDKEVIEVMNSVISDALKIDTVNIPGL